MSAATAGGAPVLSPVLSIGEALVEFMPPAGETMRSALMWERFAGGGPATFAAALARFGRPAALVTRVGEDPFSDYLLDALADEGVDTSLVRRMADRQIGLCFHEIVDGKANLLFHRRDTPATELSPDDLPGGVIESAAAVHAAGTTLQISDTARDAVVGALERARAAGVPVSFDPNLRTILGARAAQEAMEQCMRLADLVSPSLREARALTGEEDPVDAARALRAFGPRWVAVTLAAAGCVLLGDDDQPLHVPGCAVDVVEPTGSGDVHAAALLHGMLSGWDLERAGRYANAAGALAVTARGHLGPALPTTDAIDRLLAR